MKIVKQFILIALCLMLILGSMSGCSKKGKVLLSLDDAEMSVNTFQLFLSRQISLQNLS